MSAAIWPSVANPWSVYTNLVPGSATTRMPAP
jgi:hypothetical protein